MAKLTLPKYVSHGQLGKGHKAEPGVGPLLQPLFLSLAQLTLNDGSLFRLPDHIHTHNYNLGLCE
jgi:hypothetical protein